MYQALYRRFRPETFDEVLGQEHIVKILKNQINSDTTGHAYLFCGTRGTGKTSTARLLAKGVNCLAPEGGRPCGVCANCKSITEGGFMDVVEIDAASNNGVENIRELRESVKYPPVTGRCKVYIVDEVHMLSTGAFNALLKTLEEPPENVMFILATTEVQKLPATILSRCLRLDFHRIPETQLRNGMKEICRSIGVEISDSALGLIAANADGSARDGLSLLDQCISGGEKKVSREDVLTLLGTSGEEVFIELTDFIHTQQVAEALLLVDRVLSDGKDVRQFMRDWITHFRGLLMTKFIKNPEDMLNMSTENVERIRTQSERLDLPVINDSILELSKTLADAKWSTQPRILLELAIVRMGAGNFGGAPGSAGFSTGVNGGAAARRQTARPAVPQAPSGGGKRQGPFFLPGAALAGEKMKGCRATQAGGGAAGGGRDRRSHRPRPAPVCGLRRPAFWKTAPVQEDRRDHLRRWIALVRRKAQEPVMRRPDRRRAEGTRRWSRPKIPRGRVCPQRRPDRDRKQDLGRKRHRSRKPIWTSTSCGTGSLRTGRR
ncbi:DNA polymerase III subunit gamma/tau [Bacilliculturomica massiliensis]|uniref:DNA polymerase III subunit gamma/tau n=1 Tax=Bacilliculturomica massiliensis TaxID=1917867 RepID=UPI001030B820|nr:DNA polymerase III subunit gamma/tau [Bacilliculturomica massiliensis]